MKLIRLAPVVVCAGALASRAEAGEPKCYKDAYGGHCVVVKVNGQGSVKLSKKTKKLLKEMNTRSSSGGTVNYEIPTPVRGELAVSADFLPDATAYFGPTEETIAHVQALEGQALDARPEISTSSSVRAGGAVRGHAGQRVEGQPPAPRQVPALGPAHRHAPLGPPVALLRSGGLTRGRGRPREALPASLPPATTRPAARMAPRFAWTRRSPSCA